MFLGCTTPHKMQFLGADEDLTGYEKTTRVAVTGVALPNGKTFKMSADNISKDNPYVQSVTLNGKLLDRTYITDSELKSGGELHFEMGPSAK